MLKIIQRGGVAFLRPLIRNRNRSEDQPKIIESFFCCHLCCGLYRDLWEVFSRLVIYTFAYERVILTNQGVR